MTGGSPATSGAEVTPPNEPRPLVVLRGVVLDPDEPLDDLRGDDDRADRDVPARAVHRPRHLGALVEQPHPEGAPGARLLHADRDAPAGAGRRPEARARRPREVRDLRLEGEGRGSDEEELS